MLRGNFQRTYQKALWLLHRSVILPLNKHFTDERKEKMDADDDHLAQIIDKALKEMDRNWDGYIEWTEYKVHIPKKS